MDLVKLHNLAISSTGFVFDPVSGNSYNTNETGVFVINRLKEGKDARTIAQSLSDEYNVEPDNAEQDVLQLIEVLRGNYLI